MLQEKRKKGFKKFKILKKKKSRKHVSSCNCYRAIKIVITSLKKSHAESAWPLCSSLFMLCMFLILIARALEKAPKIQSLHFGLCEIHANAAIESNRDDILSVDFNRIAECPNRTRRNKTAFCHLLLNF